MNNDWYCCWWYHIALPIWVLLALDQENKVITLSEYTKVAQLAGLHIITWILERSGPLEAGGGWYYQSITDTINHDSDMLTILDILAKKAHIKGIFSDWPATVTFYANCMGLE